MFGGRGGFTDFFGSLFGSDYVRNHRTARTRTAPRRGSDVRAELNLTVSQALSPVPSRFEFPATVACDECNGSGSLGEHICPICGGLGSRRQNKVVELTIPKQIRNGMTVRLKGLGEAGHAQGSKGDLFLTIHLQSDETYRCRGADIEADVAVAPWEALDGAKVSVRSLDGTTVVTIPPNTAAGTKLRLRGRGLYRGEHAGRGDFFVVVRYQLPKTLNDQQKALIRQLGQVGPKTVQGGARED